MMPKEDVETITQVHLEQRIAQHTKIPKVQVREVIDAFVFMIKNELDNPRPLDISIRGFGAFRIRKRNTYNTYARKEMEVWKFKFTQSTLLKQVMKKGESVLAIKKARKYKKV